jgi:hypothetical protein
MKRGQKLTEITNILKICQLFLISIDFYGDLFRNNQVRKIKFLFLQYIAMERKFKGYPVSYSMDDTVQVRIFPDERDSSKMNLGEIEENSQEVSIDLASLFDHGVITKKDLKKYENCYEIPLIITTNQEIIAGKLIPTKIIKLKKATNDSIFNIIGFDVDDSLIPVENLNIFNKEEEE